MNYDMAMNPTDDDIDVEEDDSLFEEGDEAEDDEIDFMGEEEDDEEE